MNSSFVQKIILFMIVVIPVFSGITLRASDSLLVEVQTVDIRQPNEKFIESYRSQKAFSYTPPPVKTNFLQQLLDYLRRRFHSVDAFLGNMPFFFKLMLWGFLLFSLFIVVTKTGLYHVFYSDKEVNMPHYHLGFIENQIHDYDAEIQAQVVRQQYRMAVRLHYLKLIDKLRSKEYIRFSKDKTNFDYYNDLSSDYFKSKFYTVTQIFNHVWYGDMEIAEEQFLKFQQSFQSFYQAIDVEE
jgi:hypothetical protein